MEFKGTKGPWSKVTSNGIMTTNGIVVAITTKDGVITKEAEQANAKLIAAAPELLEALKLAVKELKHYMEWLTMVLLKFANQPSTKHLTNINMWKKRNIKIMHQGKVIYSINIWYY